MKEESLSVCFGFTLQSILVLRRTIFKPEHVQMGFRNVDANVMICQLLARPLFLNQWRTRSRPMLVMRDLSHAYPFRPLGKTAADQTLERSITTQPLTIQPPPLLAINGVAGSGSIIPQEPSSA